MVLFGGAIWGGAFIRGGCINVWFYMVLLCNRYVHVFEFACMVNYSGGHARFFHYNE